MDCFNKCLEWEQSMTILICRIAENTISCGPNSTPIIMRNTSVAAKQSGVTFRPHSLIDCFQGNRFAVLTPTVLLKKGIRVIDDVRWRCKYSPRSEERRVGKECRS